MIEPRATYRVQLQPDFGLTDAAELVPYLDRLGASHVYASPLARSVPGSTHGYDVVDPTEVDTPRGGPAGLAVLAASLGAHAMGLLLDVVPNHLAAHEDNPMWWSLLAAGPDGPGARTFDVEWDAPDAAGRVVLPMLGEPLADSVATGSVRVSERAGETVVAAPGVVLPVAPGTSSGPGPPEGSERVTAVLARQHYRLDYWRTGEAIVNYRRFFDVATLPAARVEDPEVFDRQMALAAALLASGTADGIRIDHVDGLRDPTTFLRRCRALGAEWLLVEKILGPDESLPDAWDVDGTTGYEFAERVAGLLVDPRAEAPLTELWTTLTGDTRTFRAHEEDGRRAVLDRLFVADRGRLTRAFGRVVGPRPDLDATLTAVLSAFTVYRTYVEAGASATGPDPARIDGAVERAVARGADPATAGAVRAVLLGEHGDDPDADDARLRFQQLCAAVTAKGVEDTAGYRYLRFAARNEVGGDPGRFAWTTRAVHVANADATRRPRALLSLSTHDSKRSADVRARLAVLSEIPAGWRAFVRARWSALDAAWAPVEPDPAIAYLLLQTAVGAWPIDRARLGRYALKAAREAKQRTSWRDPDPAYEAALDRVVGAIVDPADPAGRDALERVVAEVLVAGRVNALAQVVLQCTSPGVPDVYWGDEVWNLTLVDPDNREPPAPERITLLEELRAAGRAPDAATLADPEDPGRAKLWTLHRCLDLRRRRPEWFGPQAGYRSLTPGGAAADHVVAWERAGRVTAVVPRLTRVPPAGWTHTRVTIGTGTWRDVLTGHERRGGPVTVSELLADFPVAVLEWISAG